MDWWMEEGETIVVRHKSGFDQQLPPEGVGLRAVRHCP